MRSPAQSERHAPVDTQYPHCADSRVGEVQSPLRRAHGVDIDVDDNGTADYQRMYQLIRQPQPIADRLFEIEFVDGGVEAFASRSDAN